MAQPSRDFIMILDSPGMHYSLIDLYALYFDVNKYILSVDTRYTCIHSFYVVTFIPCYDCVENILTLQPFSLYLLKTLNINLFLKIQF